MLKSIIGKILSIIGQGLFKPQTEAQNLDNGICLSCTLLYFTMLCRYRDNISPEIVRAGNEDPLHCGI